MHTQALSPATALPGPAPFTPWSAWLAERLSTALARWAAARRARAAYHRDLVVLAGLGERELADFGAPAWLAADVQRYRNTAYLEGVI